MQATGFSTEENARQETQPGQEHKMKVKPETLPQHYKPAGKLEGKKALITGKAAGEAAGVQAGKVGGEAHRCVQPVRVRRQAGRGGFE